MRKLLLTVFMALSAMLAAAQTDIQVQMHNVVALDEQFNVTFVIEGDKPSEFSWEPGEDFLLVWGPQQGRSTSMQIINGKRTSSSQTTYSYILKPLKVGKFTIPKASAVVKGKNIYSAEQSIEVVSQGSSSSQQQSSSSAQQPAQRKEQTGMISDSDLFMKLSLSRNDVVVGEPIIATIKLYQRVNITGFESASFPSFNGFWSQEVETPTNIEFSRETYEGQIYNAAVLRKFVLIPQQKGQLKIDPAELVCLVNIRVSSGGNSIFDGFFDDYRTVRKKVISAPLTVNVKPLPSGAPASFAGGVGEFGISATVSKDSLKAHEAAALVVTVSGRGNVSLLETPKVSFPPDMEVYDTKVVSNVAANGLSGSKKYEYPFIPRSHGDFVIEPIKYSYYDVNQKKYVTLETAPIELSVAKGVETESSPVVVPGVNQKDVRNLDSDIRYINVKDPSLSVKGDFLLGSGLFWALVCLLVAAAAILWLALRKLAARRADIAGAKNRKATKMAMKRLRLAGTFLKENLYTAFYEELHKALLGFIADKLNIPVAELSRDRIAESLRAGNVPQEDVDTFINILDACEFARYSPSTGNEAMAAHYSSAAEVISSIDSSMKSKRNVTKVTAILLLLMLMPSVGYAAEDTYVDSLWNAANEAYAQAQWEAAIADYEMISTMGLESAPLYCNIGNAYYKSANIPMAVLYYERALKLDPSYADAEHNLALVNNLIQDRIDPVPEFFLRKWMKDISYVMDSDSWAVIFLILLAMTLALFLLFLLAPSAAGRRTGFFVGLVTLVLMFFCLGFSISQKNAYMSADEAIVMKPVAAVKSSPSSESSKDLFILHEGTKVTIIDQVGNWNNISLADGRQGWLPAMDMEII